MTYLFSWDNVPGNDSERLLLFLLDDLDIDWAENAEIRKSDDGKSIRIFKDENSAEIMIDEEKEKTTLKIGDGKIIDLKVKKENGKLNIYKMTNGVDKKLKEVEMVSDGKNPPISRECWIMLLSCEINREAFDFYTHWSAGIAALIGFLGGAVAVGIAGIPDKLLLFSILFILLISAIIVFVMAHIAHKNHIQNRLKPLINAREAIIDNELTYDLKQWKEYMCRYKSMASLWGWKS